MRTDQQIRRGMLEVAARQARIELGRLERPKEHGKALRGLPLLRSDPPLRLEVNLGLRMLHSVRHRMPDHELRRADPHASPGAPFRIASAHC